MDNNSAEIKSLEQIIEMMDGHQMKGYQSKLPKKPSLDDNMSVEADAPQTPGDMAEASAEQPAEASEMDDEAMQELMKMYESEDEWPKADTSAPVLGVN